MSVLTKEKIDKIVWVESIYKPTKTPIYHGYYPNQRYNKRNIKQDGNSAVCSRTLGIKGYNNEYLKTSEIKLVDFKSELKCKKCLYVLNKIKLK